MYNQVEIQSNISKIQATLKFQLAYHTYSEIEKSIDYINNLIDFQLYQETIKEGKSKTKIIFKSVKAKKEFEGDEIQQFILNETILSQLDCFYWMNNYYKISDIENKFIQYKANIPQLVWQKIFAKLQFLKRAIRALCLKARQVGLTTFAQGVVQHRLQFYPDVKSMIASKDEKSSGRMADMFMSSLNRQPFWLRSPTTSFATGSFWEFENGSRLDLGWGTQSSLAKGQTATVAHLSEIALFKRPIEAIENALIRAMHETLWHLQIFEGTAEGRDDGSNSGPAWFHRKVKETIEGMDSGSSSLYFSFVPYFVRRDIYPTQEYINGRSDSYCKFNPSLETIVHARKAENYVQTNEYLKEILGSNWRMPIETIFWYETERNAAIKRDELGVFLSQCPANWEEAFQYAGRTIFPIEVLSYYNDKAQERVPEVYKLKGDANEVPESFWPRQDEIHSSGRIIPISCNWASNIPAIDFQLVRINFDGWDRFDPTNKFLIWEHPREGFIYGSATDTSDGLGKGNSDDAVHQIFRNGTIESRDAQVCEFASPDLSLANMWPFILGINTYYSLRSMGKQIIWACEINKGYELQNKLINLGWTNLFERIDESDPSGKLTGKFGFETNPRVREALIGHINSLVLGKWIDIFSPYLIEELRDLQKVRRITEIYKIQREKILGKKDNRYLAAGICLYVLHRNAILGYEKQMWAERKRREDVSGFQLKTFEDSNYDNLVLKSFDNSGYVDIFSANDEFEGHIDKEFGELVLPALDF